MGGSKEGASCRTMGGGSMRADTTARWDGGGAPNGVRLMRGWGGSEGSAGYRTIAGGDMRTDAIVRWGGGSMANGAGGDGVTNHVGGGPRNFLAEPG